MREAVRMVGGWRCISEAVWLWPASMEHAWFFFILFKEHFLLGTCGISTLAKIFPIFYFIQQKGENGPYGFLATLWTTTVSYLGLAPPVHLHIKNFGVQKLWDNIFCFLFPGSKLSKNGPIHSVVVYT